jgi:GNAT superfamily N-acetyltransferase
VTAPPSDALPVTRYADLTIPEQPELRFVAVTDGARCSVHALDDLIVVGSLRWLIVEDDDAAGMIGFVHVVPERRRQGIATALLSVARTYAEHHGLPAPRHTDERSADGDAWARSLGAAPAAVVRDL